MSVSVPLPSTFQRRMKYRGGEPDRISRNAACATGVASLSAAPPKWRLAVPMNVMGLAAWGLVTYAPALDPSEFATDKAIPPDLLTDVLLSMLEIVCVKPVPSVPPYSVSPVSDKIVTPGHPSVLRMLPSTSLALSKRAL